MPFLQRLLLFFQTETMTEVLGVSAALLVVALLLNLFARHRRREMRRAVLLYAAFVVGALLQATLGLYGAEDGSYWLNAATHVVMGLVIVHLGAIVILDLLLPALAIELPTVLIDIALGLAYLIATGTVLAEHGIDLTSFVAVSTIAAGILTISLQSTLGNVIGGLALQLDGSIERGQWVQLENGRQGKVTVIRWRHTVLETRDWGTLIVPNSSLLSSQILILGKREGQPPQHRFTVPFHVDFRARPARVIAVVQDALRSAPILNVAAEPQPDCVCLDFARDGRDSFAYFAVRYWLTDLAADDPTSSRVRERIFAALKRAEIPFAVPTLRSIVVTDTEADTNTSRMTACRAAIAKVDMFKVLTDDERDHLAERLVPTPFSTGEVVTRQGAVAHWLYILASGSVEVRRKSDAGVDQVVAQLDAPAFFGEMGLLTGDPRSASVYATSPCECFRLDKASFEAIIRDRPDVAEAMSSVLARRRVQIQLAREGGDVSVAERVVVEEAARLVRRVRSFFGLEAE